MDSKAFTRDGANMLDYIGDFWDRLREYAPLHNVKPGYLTTTGVLPEDAPKEPETLEDVLKDVDKHIMPGITQWQHPNFFAYLPEAASYPSVLADMLSGAICCIGFSWNSGPACSELEIVMLNWLGRLLKLPEAFLNIPGGRGGGVIQGSSADAILLSMLAARTMTLRKLDTTRQKFGLVDKLVCYTSEQALCSEEKAALISHVKIRLLPTDEKFSMRGETLQKAIDEDRKQGLIPFYVCASVGTSELCAADNLEELGPICEKESLWLHVDACYAGSAAICPEYRYIIDGVELADSFNMNPNKWMMVNHDCSTMWMKDYYHIVDALTVNPIFLQHKHEDDVIDFRHLQLPLGRRFRALKLWFVFRLLGVKALQDNIRKQISLAKEFEKLVKTDDRFEIIGEVTMGLVCFRLKVSNAVNVRLVKYINEVDRRIHLVASADDKIYYLRLAICSTKTNSDDISLAWRAIQESTEQVINNSSVAANGGGMGGITAREELRI